MGTYKTYFVFDSDTGFILSGFDHCVDDHNDGYNIFTRPYKYPEFHQKDDTCRMDYIFSSAKREGLPNLKRENLMVGVVDSLFNLKQEFVKNPRYFYERKSVNGWWKLMQNVDTL